jgi:hypothetical protein
MKKQTSNLKLRYKNILIRTDKTASMYNINKKSEAKNLYGTERKIWKLSEKNSSTLKVLHIAGRINVTTDRLSRLEMSGDYHLNERVFPRIQWIWRCYPKVDLFVLKKNRLTKICVSDTKKRSRQHKKCLETGLSADPSSAENIEKISKKKENNYTDNSFLKAKYGQTY